MSSENFDLAASCDFDDSQYLSPKMYQDPKNGKWIVEGRWSTKEYDSEEKARLSILACSQISVIRPNRSVNVIEVKHTSTVSNKPTHHHIAPKPQYDPVGEDGKHWYLMHRWYTKWFETEEEANLELLSLSEDFDDDEDELEDEHTFNVSDLSLSHVSKNYFCPTVQYDPINKDYYIEGRWKTSRYETKEKATLAILSMSCDCPYPVMSSLTEDKTEHETTRHTPFIPCVKYDSVGENGKHWYIEGRWNTKWYDSEKEANLDLLSFSCEGDY